MSLNTAPVKAIAFGLVNTKVMVLVPPAAIPFGTNVLVKVGAVKTVKVSLAVALSGPSRVSTTPVVLRCAPLVADVTSIVITPVSYTHLTLPTIYSV